MKINSQIPIKISQEKSQNTLKNQHNEQDFNALIKDQLLDADKNNVNTLSLEHSAQAILNSSFSGRIAAAQASTFNLDNEAIKRLDHIIDDLEKYAESLGDSRKTLKDLSPLAENLEKQAGELAEMALNLSSDSPLKGLSNEAAVIATVEAMKFKRGDWL